MTVPKMAQDYTKTLNLPKTSFEMRANLPQREPKILEKWEEMDLYGMMMQKNSGKPRFVLHDGPPYANGNIHLGHALNKILKDFIVRYKNMSGFQSPFIPGWDTHGLPIENQMIKKHGIKRNELGAVEFRKLCDSFARSNMATQRTQMKRLGCTGDWEHPYMTILPEFEAEQIRIFGKMAKNGYIYKGMKPVYWCAHDETALAEAEIEYKDIPCDSIYVKFRVSDDKGLITPFTGSLDRVYYVIWTTTTWTLPGNMAICLGPEFTYNLVRVGDAFYILARELTESVAQACGFENWETVATFTGAELEGTVARHPFIDRPSYVIVGDHVTLDSGTGCVHTAPGFGVDDFNVCRKYPFIETIVPVDSRGRQNELAGKYCGMTTEESNAAILEDIRQSGALLAVKHITHQYPHCWRCKHPIIFRATEQWFCSVEGFREKTFDAIRTVKWIPAWGENRLTKMVEDRADWCISRQRNWGVPIPILYCEDCGEPILSDETIEKIAGLFEKEGSGAWLTYEPEQILGEALCRCPKCGCRKLRKEKDIMDVWFDSGSSYAYVLDKVLGTFPADMYLEGNDQYRGWFQSSLLTSVATRGVAPYRSVLTHGMIIDLEGRKMSKSLGNGIDPADVIKQYGADILRLWVSSVDYTNDVKISKEILGQIAEIYRKIRNTARIMLANLGTAETDFNPDTDMVPVSELHEIDQWALSRMNGLVKEVTAAYETYQFHLIYQAVNNFCTTDMSKLYIDIIKDRVYTEKRDSHDRRCAQTALYLILNALTRMIAPLLAFTAEEIWSNMAHTSDEDSRSVFLNTMPAYREELCFGDIAAHWDRLFALRDEVMKALEDARNAKLIGKSLDAKVRIETADEEKYAVLHSFEKLLPAVFIVSGVELVRGDSEKITVSAADGVKCDRCWTYSSAGLKTEDGFLCERCRRILGL